MTYTGMHTREFPNGSQANIRIHGVNSVHDLTFGDQIKISIGNRTVDAVVDLMAPAFWGGPEAAFRAYDSTGDLSIVEIRIVWKRLDGGWNESRSWRPATEKEFLDWRSQFVGNTPPQPMP